MDGYRSLLLLLVSAAVVCLCGCPKTVRQYTAPLPRTLPPSPTLEQVIEVVNRNNSQIHSFSTNEAKLSGPGFPALRASLAYQRPRRLRLRAETSLTGPEIDLGSNDELFWFWVRRSQPPGVFYCRHEQFAHARVRQAVPIEPDWLIEALGTTEFDSTLPHQGPVPLSGGRLEVRTIRETPEGPAYKITVVDGLRGLVLEQRLFDAKGSLLASSVASDHRQDPLSGLIMPKIVEVRCPAAQFTMRLDLGNVRINRLSGNPAELWAMPGYNGVPAIDLSSPSFAPSTVPLDAFTRRPAAPRRGWRR